MPHFLWRPILLPAGKPGCRNNLWLNILLLKRALSNRTQLNTLMWTSCKRAVTNYLSTLGRALIIYFNVPGEKAIDYVIYLEVAIAATLMINDIVRKRSFKATSMVFIAVASMCLLWTFRMGSLWQSIGEFVATNLF